MWSRHAAGLIDALAAAGAPRAAMLRRCGLTEGALAQREGRVPLAAVYAAVEAAADLTGDPLLGVHAARGVTLEDLDAMGFLMLTSRTMGQAMDRINRYADAFVSGERHRWFADAAGVHHEFVPFGPSRPAHRHVAELIFYDVARNSPRLFGPEVVPLEIRLAHEPAPDVDYRAVFGVPVRFRQPGYEVLFPAAIAEVSLRNTNPEMARFVDRYAERLLEALPGTGEVTARVLELIGEDLEAGPPSLAEVADALVLSPRTLQRRLVAEGTSLVALIERARRGRAEALVDAGVPLAEVAYLLGYSGQAAFQRAFRRWTGITPAAYRRRRSP